MKIAYIIGPFGANENRSETQNTLVAEYLGKQAMAQGYTPFVPHSMILSGVFGKDSDPSERKKGERATLSLLATFIKHSNVELWVIGDYIYNSWFFSKGTKKELDLWIKRRGTKDIKYFLYPAVDAERRGLYGKDMAHKRHTWTSRSIKDPT